MEIYIEYALAENFILDITLLYLSLKTVRLPIVGWRIFLAATMGAVFALFFPLFNLTGWWAFAVRYAFGFILCLTAVRSKSIKEHLLVILLFYFYTFALGGFLIGVYSFFEPLQSETGEYLIADTPVILVIFTALIFAFILIKTFSFLYRRYKNRKLLYRCVIDLKGFQIDGIGLLDTGNSLCFRGVPVCLLDKATARVLLTDSKIFPPMQTMYVHTATGGGELKIFEARLKIYSEGKENIIDKVYFAIAPATLGKGYQMILQPQLLKERERV